MRKRLTAVVLSIFLCISLISGCGSTENDAADVSDSQTSETAAPASSEPAAEPQKEENTDSDDSASMELYENFLAGKEKLNISKVDLQAYDSEFYASELKADETYTIDEFFTKFFTDWSGYNDGDYYVEELSYAYTDCGQDGTPELALQFTSYMYNDEYNNIMVIKDVGGELFLCTWLCTWVTEEYRSYNYINTYGVIFEGGSGGPSNLYDSYFGIDENGDQYVIYESEVCGAYELFMGEGVSPGDEAAILGAEDISITRYWFEAYPYIDYEEESYLAFLKENYYTFTADRDTEDEAEAEKIYAADSGYAQFMDKVTDNWYTPDEMQKILNEKLAEKGFTEEMLQEDDLSWTKWEGHEDVFSVLLSRGMPLQTYTVENPGWTYYSEDYPYEQSTDFVTLEELSHEANNIIDVEAWMAEIGAVTPFSDDMRVIKDPNGLYTYYLSSSYGEYALIYDTVLIHDNTTGQDVAKLDFSNFTLPDKHANTEQKYFTECVEYVETVDDVVYVSISHRTYAATADHNAYVMALDRNDDYRVIWKSDPLVCNSSNFAIVDSSLICGYGFTAEPDYIYELNRYTGEKMETILVKTAPDYFFVLDGNLYVRTYDTNYVYQLCWG